MILFKDPWILIGIPLILPFLWWWQRRQGRPALRFPAVSLVSGLGRSWRVRLAPLPALLRLLAVVLFLTALAGPRTILEEAKYSAEGIDIMLVIDTSRSLASEDFVLNGQRHNRLEVIKDVVAGFIDGRSHDRIGIVAFAGLAYTVSPLTKDYAWLKENLRRIDFDLIEDGTAIGSALSSALIRLKDSKAKSKVIILLTDGVNNSGRVAPLEAAQAAKALGIRVYTIGAGTKGYVPYPVKGLFGKTYYQQVKTDVDEETLQAIADTTGGKFFRATDTASLRQIYQEIDRLEKTEFEETGYRQYQELFGICLVAGLLILLLEKLLTETILLRLP